MWDRRTQSICRKAHGSFGSSPVAYTTKSRLYPKNFIRGPSLPSHRNGVPENPLPSTKQHQQGYPVQQHGEMKYWEYQFLPRKPCVQKRAGGEKWWEEVNPILVRSAVDDGVFSRYSLTLAT